MDQCRGLEGLPGGLVSQLPHGQSAQLVVNQGQELIRGVGITLLDGGQDSGQLIHISILNAGSITHPNTQRRRDKRRFVIGVALDLQSFFISVRRAGPLFRTIS